MTVLVKICGLSTFATLDAALEAGADMVGLVFFAKSPRHLSLAAAAELAAHARGRARVVALTVDADDAALAGIVDAVAPDVLQLHGRESPERVAEVRARFGRPVIKAVAIGGRDDLGAVAGYAAVADMLLFDAKPAPTAALPGGNGLAFDHRLVAGLDPGVPVMLSGGLDPATVAQAIDLVRPAAVDVSSGVERAPGDKDPAMIRAFIAAARAA
ncbi:phosphoribosylanthranilate isomerase [Blastochloris viridis]|uniref:N-(5'-phosphoribosyl)anthranilate isomerase n=1 Tax=Blastochloris viridis TaxID=1079 RepID=A0A0H5BA08_BLAVI|nr:phosphoribosylanthranilate isomerase [Blastochloris viridis]ALK11002.1 N-(5'-phosphoribosyl)anthranilate isomerase [Blastochloris viridis]BAR99010.1 phosphoribosylanthranilate isomerase [Blastochloris viridis]CUU43664.1 N-(5'-phosphoribosyl)anthranilate isomerase [Blastochloris viridis]